MKKIAVVGVYGDGEDFTTGQAVKCYTLINWLKTKYGKNQVKVVNTYMWKKTPVALLWNLILAMISCKNITMMPAQNGLRVFAPIMYYLNKLFNRKLQYIVIGGWLYDTLKDNKKMKKYIEAFDGVYVETISMLNMLNSIGLNNVYHMPNSRNYIEDVTKKEIGNENIYVCTYSRVVKEKGIEDAIEICRLANTMLNEEKFTLHIYGKLADEYKEEFEEILKINNDIVKYCGVKSPCDTIKVLSKYYALIFPTYYEGEGFAGTILDAFVSGTPIIANDWKYNNEIISDGQNGYIYSFRNTKIAAERLIKLYNDKKVYENIIKNCRLSARRFDTNSVMEEFSKRLN